MEYRTKTEDWGDISKFDEKHNFPSRMVCINSGVIWLLGIRKLPKPIHQPCLHTLPSSRKQTTVVNPNKCKGKCVFNLFGLVGEKSVVVRRSKL